MAGEAPGTADATGPVPIDLTDPAVQQDPFAHYVRLRAQGPVHRLPGPGVPTYVVCGYDAARAVLGNPQVFSSRLLPLPAMLFLDPPDHDRIRRTASRAFTARAITALEPRIAAIADDLVTRFVSRGGGDVVAEVTGRLPVYVIGEMLGVPTGEWEQLRAWSDATVRALSVGAGAGGDDAEAALAGAAALHDHLGAVAEGHAASPSDTIAGRLVACEREGELDRAELVAFLQLLFVAGHETTAALLSRCVEILAGRPALLRDLQGDSALVPAFVEEVLRAYGPLQRLFRTTTTDVDVAGRRVPAGATVVVLLGAASREEGRFEGGEDIALGAADATHLAFGHGIHRCLGAPLARLEGRVAVERLVGAVSTLDLDPDRPPERFSGGTTSELQTTSLWVTVTGSRRR